MKSNQSISDKFWDINGSYNPKYADCGYDKYKICLIVIESHSIYHFFFCFPVEYSDMNGSNHPQWDKYDWIMEEELEFQEI